MVVQWPLNIPDRPTSRNAFIINDPFVQVEIKLLAANAVGARLS